MNKLYPVFFLVLISLVIFSGCKKESDVLSQSHTESVNHTITPLSDEQIFDINSIQTSDMLQYHNGYLYFYVGSGFSSSNLETFYRYNVRTEKISTVCGDPICQHNNDECPFYGMNSLFSVHHNKIIYHRMPSFMDPKVRIQTYESCCYDMENIHLDIYSQTKSNSWSAYVMELYSGQYRFYYVPSYDENGEKLGFSLCRMNLDDGKSVVLQENSSAKENQSVISMSSLTAEMLFAVNNRLYFTDGAEIYSTDFDLNDHQTVMTGRFTSASNIVTDGEYIYLGERETENSSLLTLYRAKLDGSEKTPLGIQAYHFTLTRNYIYYENTEVVHIGKDKRSGTTLEEITEVGSALCRAKHDGSEQETVFSFKQDDTFYEFGYTCYAGDYVYAIYKSYTDTDGDGAISDNEEFASYDKENFTILRVNVNTGEFDHIRCGTENRD